MMLIAGEFCAALACAVNPCSAIVRECKQGDQRDLVTISTISTKYKTAGEDDCDDMLGMPGFEATICTRVSSRRATLGVHRRREVRRTTAEEFAKLAEQFGLKHCPKCGNACMKEDEDACDHMTCICGKEFCWSCLADRGVIFHHGNHYHEKDCRFFVAYGGPAEFIARCSDCKNNGKPCLAPNSCC